MLINITKTAKIRSSLFQQIVLRRYSSNASVIDDPPLLNKTYQQFLDAQNKVYPHKDLLRSVNEDFKWTYADTIKYQDCTASGIDELPKKGPFTVSLPLRSESLVCQLATARVNVPYAVLEPALANSQLEEQLKVVSPSTFVWAPRVHKTIQLDQIYEIFPRLKKYAPTLPINDKRFPELRNIFQVSKQDLDNLPRFADIPLSPNKHALSKHEKSNLPQNPHVILLNEDLKQITLSQYNIINTGYMTGHRAQLNEEDVVLTTLPFHRGFALSLGLGLTLSHKVKLVWASELFDPQLVIPAIETNYCSVLIIQPNDLKVLLDNVTLKTNFPNLSKVIVVSSPGNMASESLLLGLHDKLRTKSLVTFGIDETSGVISTTTLENSHSTNVVGKPLPHTEIQIIDNNGKQTPIDTPGQLLVKGFNVTTGYKNDAPYTNQKIKNGFFHTGITAKLSKNQQLEIL